MPFETLTPFQEISAVLALAAVIGFLGLVLRQPMIVTFIVVGVLSGPAVLHVVRAADYVDLLAEIGVSVLLFLIGLKLDLELIRSLGKVALATGLGQVLFTSLAGFALCTLFGLAAVPALYVAVALTFSSTIIIVKLLSDKREVDSLHGRIAIGFLVVQDLVVVGAMVALSAWGVSGAADAKSAWTVFAGGAAMLLTVIVIMRFAAERVLRRLAVAPELLITAAVAWAIAGSAASEALGFGRELGGLLAGISLASASYREAIASRLASLRDFLLLFFFVGLGTRLDLGLLGAQIGVGIALSLFVLIGNPLIVMLIMRALGYSKRTGFLAGLTVAQISEFSFIFVAKGREIGHVDRDAVGIVTLVGVVTIAASTYMIVHSHVLYAKLEPLLRVFDPRRLRDDVACAPAEGADVILFGLGRFGGGIARRLRDRGRRVLGVDFDPEIVRARAAEGIDAVFGDADDPNVAEMLPVAEAKWLVVTFPPVSAGVIGADARLALIDAVKAHGFAGRVAVTSHDELDRAAMSQLGADLVLMPYEEAARGAADHIDGSFGAAPG